MLGENGFCDNGPHTAGLKDSHQRGDGMDEEDDEIAYPLSYQFPNSNTFNVLGISPGTRLSTTTSHGPWLGCRKALLIIALVLVHDLVDIKQINGAFAGCRTEQSMFLIICE